MNPAIPLAVAGGLLMLWANAPKKVAKRAKSIPRGPQHQSTEYADVWYSTLMGYMSEPSEPRPASFYRVGPVDFRLKEVAGRALYGGPVTSPVVLQYQKCIRSVPWNLHWFGKDSGGAFERTNGPLLETLVERKWPKRNLGTTLGLLWLPPAVLEDGQLRCEPSGPPAALLDNLQGTPPAFYTG